MINRIDLLLTVCELYYNEKLTQAQIAKQLDTSRATISRMLDKARELGIVQISITTPLNTNSTLAMTIKKKFKLKDVIVLNNTGSYPHDLSNLGKIISSFVNEIINKGDSIGISWGSAIESFVTNMPNTQWEDVKIIQINGSLGSQDSTMDGSELVIRLGEKAQCQYELLSAPAFVDSQYLQKELFEQPQIKKVIAQGSTYNISVTGIGNLISKNNTLYNAKIISDYDLKKLKLNGAIGHLAGRMYNIYGEEVYIEDKWPISPSIDTFKIVPTSIGCAIGEDRVEAVYGAINGKLINTLICDEQLANLLMTF